HEAQQKRIGQKPERRVEQEAQCLVHVFPYPRIPYPLPRPVHPPLPNSSPSSRARIAAAFTAATIFDLTLSASSMDTARSVVPPFAVTRSRSGARAPGESFG